MGSMNRLGRRAAPWFVLTACAVVPSQGFAQAKAEGSAPAAAPAQSSEEAPADKAEEKKPSVTLGSSWTDKPRRRYRRARKIDPNAPIATYPGFMMLADGTSQVWVYVSKKVPVQVSAAAGQVTYVLTGADIAVFNNTRALLTEYFDTPLRSARLRRDKNGAQLVLTMRENTPNPVHKIDDGPGGLMVLRIQLPKAQRRYSDAPFRQLPRRARGK